nr:hypothetical protein [Maliibacterium massiliense]
MYLVLLFLLVAGLVAGIATASRIDEAQRMELGVYLGNVATAAQAEQVRAIDVFWQSALSSLHVAVLMLVSASALPLLALGCCAMAFQGFTLGFTITTFVWLYGWRGIMMGLGMLLVPHLLLWLCYMEMGATAAQYALASFRMRRQGRRLADPQKMRSELFIRMLVLYAICVGIGLLHMALAPQLMRLLPQVQY